VLNREDFHSDSELELLLEKGAAPNNPTSNPPLNFN
jgi:hypothetical protein